MGRSRDPAVGKELLRGDNRLRPSSLKLRDLLLPAVGVVFKHLLNTLHWLVLKCFEIC